ncbi:MAG: LysM peptidoglycan-binding domain-containing protein [Deltaproteobacteria bacterium]|nr:LysM peptidoglycan-binding domain-containing protein [Deltaproteobacteria bacterium]MBW1949667.1 LysM peptidoglycan-binding domain-containing protein [Deltaproteobacteria bacterium]MBW2008110.1 LysM peptidoglycan-binding domain-containing protein [Deltaproteobacteria bacterium]MBW2348476.1 LysM peptidoglycan-binding domain-containing protein [Deltaproteobacteria bacterium]
MEEVLEDVAQELGYGMEEKTRAPAGRLVSTARRPALLSAVALGVGLAALLLSLWALFAGGPHVEWNEVKHRIDGMEERLARVEEKVGTLKGSMAARSELRDLHRRVSALSGKVARLERRKGTRPRTAGSRTGTAKYHVVRRGESLYLIAKRYGLSLAALTRMNGLTSKSVIRPGQKLLVSRGNTR